ncbi:hypothetical protein C0J52_26678 [Blattella germanica]|nr:hypothetical protein C0J52_26678 [Blattella germanica]
MLHNSTKKRLESIEKQKKVLKFKKVKNIPIPKHASNSVFVDNFFMGKQLHQFVVKNQPLSHLRRYDLYQAVMVIIKFTKTTGYYANTW